MTAKNLITGALIKTTAIQSEHSMMERKREAAVLPRTLVVGFPAKVVKTI